MTVADWTRTDDRGEYRLFGLAPGSYVVSVVPRAAPRVEGDSLVTPSLATNGNGSRQSESTKLTLEAIQAAAFERAVYSTV